MATIKLNDDCEWDSRQLQGKEGKFEVTKAESIEVSAFVASHYYASHRLDVVFDESDRKELSSLPDRELSMLAVALQCEPSEVVNLLLPKKKAPRKKAPSKKEQSE